jgi:hypothetical protein
MLLAISASFDETLELTVENPGTSIPLMFYGACGFAIVVCETLLRGIRLRLPAGFRLPFYAILATFYLYPVLLIQWMRDPSAPSMNWGLFCFSAVMGGLFLTLLPAVRGGANYVSNNGSPWRWPWYPWILFGVLAFGVCARAYYLCYSLHGVVGFRSIFGLYFLVPFLFAANVLLLEAGLVSQKKGVIRLALLLPIGLVTLAMTASPANAADVGFLKLFHDTLHASPLFLTMSAVTAFYFVAMVRRVPHAWLAASLALIVLSFAGPDTFNPDTCAGPYGLPILAAGGLFFLVGVLRRHAVGCLLGACCAVAAPWIDFHDTALGAYHGAIPAHLLLVSVLIVGAVFRDDRGRWIQNLGAAAILFLALTAANCTFWRCTDLPDAALTFYPPILAIVAVGYGLLVKNRWYYASAVGSLCGWAAGTGWSVYRQARHAVAGLNYIVLGAIFFIAALLVSLSKMGLLQRLFLRGRKRK